MRCLACFCENPTGAQWCKNCGITFPKDTEPAPSGNRAIKARLHRGGFFSFGTMISPTFIHVSYFIGAVVITLAALLVVVVVLTGVASDYTDTSRDALLVGGLTALVVGNILWRVLCEMSIVGFRMHEVLVSLDDRARTLIKLLAAMK